MNGRDIGRNTGRRRIGTCTLHALLPLFAVVLAGRALAAEEVAFTDTQLQALGVELASPVATETALGPSYPARVALPPGQERVVTAGEGGVVEAVLASEGQSVQAGEPLLRLRSAGIAELQRQYLQALEQAELADRQAERDEALFRDGIIPERRVQESRTAQAQARASAQGARQGLEAAGLSAQDFKALEQSRRVSSTQVLRAPFAGTVLEVLVRSGERLEATAALLRLGRTEALWLEIRVPVEAVAGIAAGAGVRVAGTGATGHVIFVGQRVDPADQSVVVRAQVDSGAQTLRPGQLVEVHFVQAGGASAFRLPAGAVVRRGEGYYVFVRTPQGFRVEPVQLLAAEADESVVSAALTPEDRVAVRGVAAIKGAWLGLGGE